jgi:hypothetical protein
MPISKLLTSLVYQMVPDKRVQSDAAPRPVIGVKLDYVTHFELKHTSEEPRRG